jgi:pimeloyl-ACP methyl ester carboxylesterase
MHRMAESFDTPIRRCRVERHAIRGIDYAVHTWGHPGAFTLVCLHGWGDSGASFQFLADALGDDWHVVAPDWRGFGRSSWNAGGYWFPDYLADLDALLSIYSPDEPARVLGHSMGGNVAGLFAGIRPDRVRAFVNVEGFGLGDSDPADAPLRYRDWLERDARSESFSSYADFDALAERILSRSPHMGPARARYVAECWAEVRDGRVILRADPRHRLPNPVLYRRAEAEACWRRVTAPVLLVAGEDSTFRRAGHRHDGAFDFDLPFPHRSLADIPAAGHMLHFEAPGALAAEARDFLVKYV